MVGRVNVEGFAQMIADALGSQCVTQEDRDLARALLESGRVHLTDLPEDAPAPDEIAARLQAAEMRAVEVQDFAGAHMLGEIHRDWLAGSMPLGNVEIALGSAAKRVAQRQEQEPPPLPDTRGGESL